MKRLLGISLVMIITVELLCSIMVAPKIKASAPALYTQKWYTFSDDESTYDVYCLSTSELTELYGRPLSKIEDAPSIVRIYLEQNGNPVEDLAKIVNVILDTQSCARFVQSVTNDDVHRSIPEIDYEFFLRKDDRGNDYNVAVPSFVQDWFQNYLLSGVEIIGYPLIPGLDNYDYRVKIYQQVLLKVVVQEELYDNIGNNIEYIETLKAILAKAGIPSEIKDFILSSYATVKKIPPETMEKIFMKNVEEVLKNLEKSLESKEASIKWLAPSLKWLREHLEQLSKVAKIIEAAEIAISISNDALRLMLLGTIANAHADHRLEVIKWWIDNFYQYINDPAIIEAFEKANETMQNVYKKYYESIFNCIKDAIDLNKIIDIGFFLLKLVNALAFLPWQYSIKLILWMFDIKDLMAQVSLAATLHKKLCDTLTGERINLSNNDPKPFKVVHNLLELFQMNYYLGFVFYKDYLKAIDNPLTRIQEALFDWAKEMMRYCNNKKDENLRNARELLPPSCLAGWAWRGWNDLWITQKAGLKLNFYISVEPTSLFYKPGETTEISVHVTNLLGEETEYWLGVSYKDPFGESKVYDTQITSTPTSKTLEPGETATHIVQWTVPKDAPLGVYWVTVNCSKDNTYTEKFDDNLDVWVPIFYIYKTIIKTPTSENPVFVGSPANPARIKVCIFLPIPFLPITAFEVSVGEQPANFTKAISTMVPIGPFSGISLFAEAIGLYTFDVETPVQQEVGSYDLRVKVSCDGISDVAEEEDAIIYTSFPIVEPVEKGLKWLRDRQYSDGSWRSNVGVTALCTLAFLNAGFDEKDPIVQKAISYMLSKVRADGSIYSSSNWATYETSLAVLPLIATRNATYSAVIENAKNWLVRCQLDEGEGITKDDWRYGGFGYYIGSRPDLSNTQFAALALEAAGLARDHPLWSKLQIFLHRCQKVNFPINVTIDGSIYTVQPWNYAGTTGGYDGGFVYLPGDNPYYTGGEPSMGAMTGAGIWCLLLAGVPKTDRRVIEAINWVINHYTWDTNPNSAGYRRYYYYLTMAKALTMYREKIIGGHDWYEELSNKITNEMISVGDDKGYWNPAQEDFGPELPTAYAILTLQTGVTAPTVQQLSYLTFILRSNCLLRIIDPDGYDVGYNYKTGRGENHVPTAVYSGPFNEPQYIVVVNPKAGTYRLELLGISEGPYELIIQGSYGEEITDKFEYTGEIKPAELYGCDVTVTAIVGPIDIYASPPEFEEIIDNIPPTTTLEVGEPKYVDPLGKIYVTPATPFTLTAEDNLGGTGVASIFYRIYNNTYDTGWLQYSAPFYLTGLAGGEYSIDYYSVDNAGNTEPTNTITVALLTVTVEFHLQTLNLKSRGEWITAYIELPEGYDVADINVATIMLNDTIPAELEPAIIGDYDGDGIPDLKVCFNRTQLIDYIMSKKIAYGNITLTISGKLYDETPFEGSATIKVSSLPGDVNCDGKVDIYDIVAAAISYDSKEGEPNWNPNANFAPPWDEIDIFDIVTIAYHYGETYP